MDCIGERYAHAPLHPLGQGAALQSRPEWALRPGRVTHGGGDGEVPITPGLGQGFSN